MTRPARKGHAMGKPIFRILMVWVGGLVCLIGLTWAVSHGADPRPKPVPPEVCLDSFKPQWRLGQTWVVETTSLPIQTAHAAHQHAGGRMVRWRFTVRAIEKVGGEECFRVEVQPLEPTQPGPVTTFWADVRSLVLRHWQSTIPVAGGWRTLVETYQHVGGQPSPVHGPLTVLPIDMPLLADRPVKGLDRFVYEAIPGPPGQKALGEPGFVVAIEQDTEPAHSDQVKALLGEEFTKDPSAGSLLEVRLSSPLRKVRQLWQPNQPWPMYVDNGTTIARLVQDPAAR
jgi:hypothetical protein